MRLYVTHFRSMPREQYCGSVLYQLCSLKVPDSIFGLNLRSNEISRFDHKEPEIHQKCSFPLPHPLIFISLPDA
jgi:hypothetical protein